MLPALLIVLCVVLRIVPGSPANFAPVGASAVMAGRTLPVGIGIPAVLLAMFVGDAALAWLRGYPLLTWETPLVYVAFAGQVLLGRLWRAKSGGAIGAAAAGSLLFFVLSNLGVFLVGRYGYSWSGLTTCFAMALPFYGRTLASDLLWTVALSLGFKAVASRVEATRPGWVPVKTSEVASF